MESRLSSKKHGSSRFNRKMSSTQSPASGWKVFSHTFSSIRYHQKCLLQTIVLLLLYPVFSTCPSSLLSLFSLIQTMLLTLQGVFPQGEYGNIGMYTRIVYGIQTILHKHGSSRPITRCPPRGHQLIGRTVVFCHTFSSIHHHQKCLLWTIALISQSLLLSKFLKTRTLLFLSFPLDSHYYIALQQ